MVDGAAWPESLITTIYSIKKAGNHLITGLCVLSVWCVLDLEGSLLAVKLAAAMGLSQGDGFSLLSLPVFTNS
jgi:hypothetical protein